MYCLFEFCVYHCETLRSSRIAGNMHLAVQGFVRDVVTFFGRVVFFHLTCLRCTFPGQGRNPATPGVLCLVYVC